MIRRDVSLSSGSGSTGLSQPRCESAGTVLARVGPTAEEFTGQEISRLRV